MDNTFWIIRSVDERTTGTCKHLIKQFLPHDGLQVINEQPFSAAIRKTFELGAASGAKWTVCIDADVLIRQEGILGLLEVAESLSDDVYYVQGLTVDKLLPIIRSPGNGIYRNKWVKKAMQFIPQDGTSVRPETTTMQGMLADGHKFYRTDIIVGLHDYEQWYKDIYRKSFLHSIKHRNAFPMVQEYWEEHKAVDKDFEVALLGARIGQTYNGRVYIDKNFQQEEWEIIKKLRDIEEKPSLKDNAITDADVQQIIDTFETHNALQQLKFPEYNRRYYLQGKLPIYKRIPKLFIKKISNLLLKTGNFTRHYASRM